MAVLLATLLAVAFPASAASNNLAGCDTGRPTDGDGNATSVGGEV